MSDISRAEGERLRDRICPNCGLPMEKHELYRDGMCPIVRVNADMYTARDKMFGITTTMQLSAEQDATALLNQAYEDGRKDQMEVDAAICDAESNAAMTDPYDPEEYAASSAADACAIEIRATYKLRHDTREAESRTDAQT